jgi:hypothetical protein
LDAGEWVLLLVSVLLLVVSPFFIYRHIVRDQRAIAFLYTMAFAFGVFIPLELIRYGR